MSGLRGPAERLGTGADPVGARRTRRPDADAATDPLCRLVEQPPQPSDPDVDDASVAVSNQANVRMTSATCGMSELPAATTPTAGAQNLGHPCSRLQKLTFVM